MSQQTVNALILWLGVPAFVLGVVVILGTLGKRRRSRRRP